MKYRELFEMLRDLNEDDLDQDVIIYDGSEYHPVTGVEFAKDCDVLDDGHPFLSTQSPQEQSQPEDKFLSGDHPAFSVGTKWTSTDGAGLDVVIEKVRPYNGGPMDYTVFYRECDGSISTKDMWSFQVRYHPV